MRSNSLLLLALPLLAQAQTHGEGEEGASMGPVAFMSVFAKFVLGYSLTLVPGGQPIDHGMLQMITLGLVAARVDRQIEQSILSPKARWH
jgi:hypothetical protein